jgi:photosystem II stability/assembly factor-like uncharacterized protein
VFDTYVGTQGGVYRIDGEARLLGLAEERISAVHALSDASGATVLLAGTYGNGLYRSADEGRTWAPSSSGMKAPAARTLVPDPLQPGALLCGTEPARIYRSADEGRSWVELAGIRALPGCDEWFLPYSPRAGAVRNVLAPQGSEDRLLASVEVGGLLESRDGGTTWSIGPVGPNDDIHQIAGTPGSPDVLWCSLGRASLPSQARGAARLGGVARSSDGGRSWEILHTDYTRSTIVPPARPDLVLSGPAPEVGRRGRIEVSADGGDSWEPAAAGIETPMPDMVERFEVAPDDSIFAVCSDGGLLHAYPGEWRWRSALPEGLGAGAVSVAFLER